MNNLLRCCLVGCLLLVAPLAHAVETPPPLAALAAKVAPAVVSITALSPTSQAAASGDSSDGNTGGDGSGVTSTGDNGPTADAQKSNGLVIPPPQTIEALGSGFIFEPSGYILTNNHVVQGATDITVTLANGAVYPAIIAGLDPDADLAVLKIDTGHPLPFLQFGDSAKMQVGDWVLAIGNPYGMSNTNTVGIVSALHRQIGDTKFDDFIQTDAAINKGNSGGPLLNMQGQVIGVNSAIYAPTGTSDGIGFAIPSSMAQPVANALVRNGKMIRGWLGVDIQELSPEIQKALRLPSVNGVLVGGVASNGPAAGKLEPGDVITAINGADIDNPRALYIRLAEIQAGQEVPVSYIRDGAAAQTSVIITVSPPAAATPTGQGQANSVPPLELSDYGLAFSDTPGASGVTVTTASGPAAAAGIMAGDVITQVNGVFVTGAKQFASQMQALRQGLAALLITGPTKADSKTTQRWVAVKPVPQPSATKQSDQPAPQPSTAKHHDKQPAKNEMVGA